MSFHPCDADASGVERALVVVYTNDGPIELCVHHFNQHCEAFIERLYMGVDLKPPYLPPMKLVALWRTDVPLSELGTNLNVRSV